ncbi:MAG: phosphoribosylamine--glycine ligase [Defluviitaleaceae bacterium]|nr:phosphoribosylamine--glycine ligase [Defluviitaleaceae bacterium]
MKILVIGGGGREHAIIWRLANNPGNVRHEIFCAPGNAGTAEIATNVDISAMDIYALRDFALVKKIDLTVVGPEDALAAGIVDAFAEVGLPAFGPTKAAARLESSKSFGKEFMRKFGIPTAAYQGFSDFVQAKGFINVTAKFPCYIKADGLAVGKGAYYCHDKAAALATLDEIMVEKRFGGAGDTVVIEEYLEGPETTLLCFCDGKTIVPMLSSMDYQKVNDNNEGPNTGGMGVLAPSPHYTTDVQKAVEEKIVWPTLHGLQAENIDFRGIIYIGLILTKNGPYVIEYNARFGDPETQAILPLLATDLSKIFFSCINQTLDKDLVSWYPDVSGACVVLASGGYPDKFTKGYPIKGLEEACVLCKDALIFHAGTTKADGEVITNGGRVLGVVATAATLDAAVTKAYEAAVHISFTNMHKRTDIGKY